MIELKRTSPYPVASFYVRKKNVGICVWEGEGKPLQCSIIHSYVEKTKKVISKVMEEKHVKMVLLNKSSHTLIVEEVLDEGLEVMEIQEKGLLDDVIENNLAKLNVNPLHLKLEARQAYIDRMKWEAQSIGEEKEKFRALGMLLYFLFSEVSISLKDQIYLDQIDYFTDQLLYNVTVTNHQLSFLQIIQEQIHPSLIKGKGKSKQGTSILGLYESMLNLRGSKKYLKNILLNPTYNSEILHERFQLIQWMNSCFPNKQILGQISKGIHSIDQLVKRFKTMRAEEDDWRKLANSIQNCLIFYKVVHEKMMKQQSRPIILEHLMEELDWEPIVGLLGILQKNINFQEFCIKKGVDEQLDRKKKMYDSLPEMLSLYARQQGWGIDFQIVAVDQVGYLIKVPLTVSQMSLSDEDDWVIHFQNEEARYYHNSLTEDLDERFGDMGPEIRDRQSCIFWNLQTIIIENLQNLQNMYWVICELQCYFCLSMFNKKMSRPRFSSEELVICRGWHLLLGNDAIENHAFSFNHRKAPLNHVYNSEENLINTAYSNRISVLTGPNGAGKSVYIKQTAIIVYLAHCGLMVPAQLAQIPIIDRLLVLEPRQESMCRGISGFQLEIQELSNLFTWGYLTNKSFLLIDQLCSKTDMQIGLKLIYSIIQTIPSPSHQFKINQYLQKAGDVFDFPLSMIVTHLTNILSRKFIQNSSKVRLLTMEMGRDYAKLYHLKPGMVKKGYGIECGKKIMGEEFIKQAHQFLDQIQYE